jgi:anti-sigma regulatory factor (Ser/Thr protein kinase)
MPAHETGLASTRAGSREQLLATCRRQETVIDTLSAGARALKAENTQLRTEIARLRAHGRPGPDHTIQGAELADVEIQLDERAPGDARRLVARCLSGHVAARVLENAQLLTSELVTNSVRHSGASVDRPVVVRVHLSQDACSVEVEDAGFDGVIAPQPPDLSLGSGMGLNLVQMLSQRWGVVRAVGGPTRVWAELACARALT